MIWCLGSTLTSSIDEAPSTVKPNARTGRCPTADGLIAVTALEHRLTLVTRNLTDFGGLSIDILNPLEQSVPYLIRRQLHAQDPVTAKDLVYERDLMVFRSPGAKLDIEGADGSNAGNEVIQGQWADTMIALRELCSRCKRLRHIASKAYERTVTEEP